ncbi:MAG: LLM class flavin-dependent oxidoreductase, partial [Candidatus Tectomicrobia bacterium]|nr:LLM class flavin-dependent oxidoreductase [Candidatus Tectomicrobia bacterium]
MRPASSPSARPARAPSPGGSRPRRSPPSPGRTTTGGASGLQSRSRPRQKNAQPTRLGDRLGYRCAWLVEDHFMRGYSHASKPELLLAAAAARTRRIRLGHAVIPLPLHHPV